MVDDLVPFTEFLEKRNQALENPRPDREDWANRASGKVERTGAGAEIKLIAAPEKLKKVALPTVATPRVSPVPSQDGALRENLDAFVKNFDEQVVAIDTALREIRLRLRRKQIEFHQLIKQSKGDT